MVVGSITIFNIYYKREMLVRDNVFVSLSNSKARESGLVSYCVSNNYITKEYTQMSCTHYNHKICISTKGFI